MKLIFIRHGDPDYATDSLTLTGTEEARRLHDFLKNENLGDIYCSPLGRAMKTAELALGSTENVTTKEWLKEFNSQVDPNGCREIQLAYGQDLQSEGDHFVLRNCWDLLPEYYFSHPELRDRLLWRNSLVARHSQTVQQYDYVTSEFDKLLEQYGYSRRDGYYHVEKGNHDVVTFICHFGISSVLLSHLMDVSPFVIMQSTCIPPTGISIAVTEEREKGFALFRILQLGATPHLEKPSFHARFAECYEDDSRH
ncbi:MAG: histidine phosphatase family protein [Erysipelotrichaceae bacterium]|nr:histidine phosphatase family protein [Erysipelotrichaceae bacterium]